ncbi:MAG: MBL fold metallo-hydrolase [Candidatus Planktophila sp.]|nr:MBL fold metallo-hydrolase [Candidatus Planktophila sp.]
MAFDIQFLGAASTVTGSKYLLTHNGIKILIDCGLFQGPKDLRLRNWNNFPVNPAEINAIILTHAHIDHSGYIPRLVKQGFRGKIYCTPATKELCEILLPDSGYLMEEEAAYLNRHKKSKHNPALPLFTVEEAEDALKLFEVVAFKENTSLGSDISFELHYAGHILGAASAIIEISGKKIAFTGDIGRMNDRIFFPPELLPRIDYLVTESTYGNRLHEESNDLDELANAINETYQRNGVILIPAFAVGRAQALMYDLSILRKQNRIPEFPMYLNSPMATNVSNLFCEYHELHKLSEAECDKTCEVVKYVRTVEESKALNERKGPLLIISASGMLTGGRILHHLKAFAPQPENMILLSGYQAEGTRGAALEKGVREIKIHGDVVSVRAQIRSLHNMSAHADYNEIIEWFSRSKIQPERVFLTHGEAVGAEEFAVKLNETFGWQCTVPKQDELISLT